MKMIVRNTIHLLFQLYFIIHSGCGYVISERLDTSDGYCDLDGYGRIPVGQTGYAVNECEKAECREGEYYIAGCTATWRDKEDCDLAVGTGQYPDCCLRRDCKKIIEKNKNWFCSLCNGKYYGSL